MKSVIFALGLAASISGCASVDWTGNGAPETAGEKFTMTGSMIPRKQVPDGVKAVDKDQMERSMQQQGTNNGTR
ncbi:hypothetical protein [Pseudoduganella sp. RAF53_2]|jgi:hypothetical protein|uniref:hypothetical protein n=1 Tax=unclassified Pseudoduganella TaxID=2637179 RepID=UPI003F9E8DC4